MALPGEGDLVPATVPIWEDSVLAERSTVRYAVRASPSSSRRSLSYMGSPFQGISLEFQRSDPGGPRRRILSWNSGDFAARVGDLDPWSEDPLVEGASRSQGSTARSETSGWLEGSGYYPNGVDASGSEGSLRLRGRWRSDRCAGGRKEGAGSVHLGAGPFQISLRSEDGPRGSDQAASAGIDWARFRFRTATNEHGDPAFWAFVDSADGIWHWRGSSRWISKGYRHGGIPSTWPGSTALDARLTANAAASTRATWRIQALLDSLHGPDIRTGIQLRTRPVPGLQIRSDGIVDRGRDKIWGSSRLGIGVSRGTLLPWLEQSWSDSGGSPILTTSLGLRWAPGGHVLRAELLWNWSKGPSLLVSHEGRVPVDEWDLGFRIEGGSDLSTGDALRGQGILTCAW